MYSILEISWSANNRTVFKLKRLEQKLKRSSKLGPSNSITITLKSPSDPHHLMVGIPTPPCIIRQNFDSMCNCGCFVLIHSNFIATEKKLKVKLYIISLILGISYFVSPKYTTLSSLPSSRVEMCVPRYMSPKDPEPILRPSRYLFPTLNSIVNFSEFRLVYSFVSQIFQVFEIFSILYNLFVLLVISLEMPHFFPPCVQKVFLNCQSYGSVIS